MSRLTRDGTAEPVSRDQILRHARGQGNVHFPCSADHEQDRQPYPVDPYSAICDDHTYIHTYIHTGSTTAFDSSWECSSQVCRRSCQGNHALERTLQRCDGEEGHIQTISIKTASSESVFVTLLASNLDSSEDLDALRFSLKNSILDSPEKSARSNWNL